MNLFRNERPILGLALAAVLVLAPACTKKAAAPAGPTGIPIHGRILAADGSAPKLGHVSYTKADGQEVSMDTQADGSFEITVPAGAPLTLHLAAVDHVSQDLRCPKISHAKAYQFDGCLER